MGGRGAPRHYPPWQSSNSLAWHPLGELPRCPNPLLCSPRPSHMPAALSLAHGGRAPVALCLSCLTLAASGVLGPLARAWGCPLSEAKLRLPGRLCSGREASGSFQPPANALEPSYNYPFIHSFVCSPLICALTSLLVSSPGFLRGRRKASGQVQLGRKRVNARPLTVGTE